MVNIKKHLPLWKNSSDKNKLHRQQWWMVPKKDEHGQWWWGYQKVRLVRLPNQEQAKKEFLEKYNKWD